MTELQLLVEVSRNIATRTETLFQEKWKARFRATNSREEFNKVLEDLKAEAGVQEDLPGAMEVLVLIELDQYRMRTRDFSKS